MKTLALSFAAAVFAVGCLPRENGYVVHVSPEGDDSADGSRSRPVKTLSAARDLVRSAKAKGALPPGGATVLLESGVYYLEEPLALDGRDSGAADLPIVWRAAKRGEAIISGARALDWKPAAKDDPLLALVPEETRTNVLVADVPGKGALPGFEGGFGQDNAFHVSLFRKGARLPLARWPNDEDSFYPVTTIDFDHHTGKDKVKVPQVVDAKVSVDEARLERWAKEPNLWTWSAWKYLWADSTVPVKRVDVKAKTLGVPGKNVHYGVAVGENRGGTWHALNAFSEIDRPDEWAADLKNRRIYLNPGKDGAKDVVASGALTLVNAEGVADVAFEGVVFEGSRGDAIRWRNCTNVVLRASAVRGTGGWGMKISGGRLCKVEGCDLYEIGEGGVDMIGGERKTLTPCGHEVTNCHFHHYGRQVYNYRPAVKMYGVGCRCTHNLIHHARHAGIIFGGNDQYIGFNVIHDVCQKNYDCGAIYTHTKTDWSERGSVVEWNMIHMVGLPRGSGCTMAYYVDGWSSGVTVRHNIASRATQGVFQNGGNDNEFSCNLVLCCVAPVTRSNLGLMGGKHPYPTLGGLGKESFLYRNLVKERALFETPLWRSRYPHLLDPLAEADPIRAHNPFWSVDTNNVSVMSGKMKFADMDQMVGRQTITNNLEMTGTDPGFVDYEHFNWELRPDAPARKVLGGGTRWAEMGLVDSPWRFSPPVKVGEGIMHVFRGPDSPPPTATVRVIFKGSLAAGAKEYAVDLDNCATYRQWWPKGNTFSLGSLGGTSLRTGGDWKRYECSLTPTGDGEATLDVSGWRGDKTLYDDFVVTGAELADGGFETGKGWTVPPPNPKMAEYGRIDGVHGIVGELPGGYKPRTGAKMLVCNAYLTAYAKLKVKKGVPLKIVFWARAYSPDEE